MRVALASLVIVFGLAACVSQPPRPPTGADTFGTHCAACHGAQGAGDGPVAATIRGGVPDLRRLSDRNGGAFPEDRVASVIDGRDLPLAHGSRQMPVWGSVFDATGRLVVDAAAAETRVKDLVAHLRTMQR